MPPASSSCAFPLPPLILTTALRPDSAFTRARDGRQRRGWAAMTLQRWLNYTSLGIVVVDATVRSVAELDFLRDMGPPARLEVLAMPLPERPLDPGKTKGYREAQQIRFAAFGASQLLRGCRYFAHATGNRFVANAQSLLQAAVELDVVVGVPKHTISVAVRWTSPTRPWIDSSFVLWTRSFLLQHFDSDAISELPGPPRSTAEGPPALTSSESNPFEVILARAVLSAHSAGQAVAWFSCVHTIGWSGSHAGAVHRPCNARAARGVQASRLSANREIPQAQGLTSGRQRINVSDIGQHYVGMKKRVRASSVGGFGCADLVVPVDPAPIRSPQAVHTQLLPHLQGRHVVEIGTRNGDGLLCFARVAKSVVAVEADTSYCERLHHRISAVAKDADHLSSLPPSAALHRTSRQMLQRMAPVQAASSPAPIPQSIPQARWNVSLQCSRYQAGLPDADLYTWWQQVPNLSNEAVLSYLVRLQRMGRIRASAEAILLFDRGHGPDIASLRRLRHLFRWEETVSFDELPLCYRRLPPGHPDRRWCYRARGVFAIAGLTLRHLAADSTV